MHSRAFKQEALVSLPLAAQPAVSEAIGRSSSSYWVHQRGSALSASSRAQRLSSRFTSSGVAVSAGGAHLHMRLSAAGYGAALRPVAVAVPRASANRVIYAHPGVEEWYANGPLGLEQGFTVARAPAGAARGPLTIALAVSASAPPVLSPDRRSVEFGSSPNALRYSGLVAEDASGRRLQSWLSLSAGRLLLHIRTGGARYPLRIDPFVQTGEALSGTGGTSGNQFGHSVAVAGDGETMIVGAYEDGEHNPKEGHPGAAFVFVRKGANWEQQGPKLTATGGEEPKYFGYSVALSQSGNTAIVGSWGTNAYKGAAYVFTRLGSTWSQQAELLDSEELPEAQFGRSVSLSAEGNTALIGAPYRANKSTCCVGGAWVFRLEGGNWKQQGGALTGEEQQSEFGYSVALSGEGNTALIGAKEEEVKEGAKKYLSAGSAYVYQYSSGKKEWLKQARFVAPGGFEKETSYFGTGVALSGNGNTAFVGAPLYESEHRGIAVIFTRAGETWTEKELLGGGEGFGETIALSGGEGTTALIGGNGVSAYTLSGGKYELIEQLTHKGGSGGFGDAVGLSENGDIALVGGSTSAWAYAFEAPAPPPKIHPGAVGPKTTAAVVSAEVNPNGAETECKVEYGLTSSYGKSVSCGSIAAGGSFVAVSAEIPGLSEKTVYHYRIVAKNDGGATDSEDLTLTTLAFSASKEVKTTKEEEVHCATCEVKIGAAVSGGEGTITVGEYNSSKIGGPPLPAALAAEKSQGKRQVYQDVNTSPAAGFGTVEITTELQYEGEQVYWYNPETGWEVPSEVKYAGTPEKATIKVTNATKPSLKQLNGTRFGLALPELAAYGKCEALKHGLYADSGCTTKDEKNGVAKGKYEWYSAPVSCYAQKKGFYEESKCAKRDEKKGKPKGKYEAGLNVSTGEAQSVKLGAIECHELKTEQEFTALKSATTKLTFSKCTRKAAPCTSTGQEAETIVAGSVETKLYEEYEEEEGGKRKPTGKLFISWGFTSSAGAPLLSFSCGGEAFSVIGDVIGETTGGINAMTTSAKTAFAPSTGVQGLTITGPSTSEEAALSAAVTTSNAQMFEIDTHGVP